jgi:hypothetical protein
MNLDFRKTALVLIYQFFYFTNSFQQYRSQRSLIHPQIHKHLVRHGSAIQPLYSAQIHRLWSEAGVMSCIQVKGESKYDNFLFDCGLYEQETISANHVFITHGHLDHIG